MFNVVHSLLLDYIVKFQIKSKLLLLDLLSTFRAFLLKGSVELKFFLEFYDIFIWQPHATTSTGEGLNMKFFSTVIYSITNAYNSF